LRSPSLEDPKLKKQEENLRGKKIPGGGCLSRELIRETDRIKNKKKRKKECNYQEGYCSQKEDTRRQMSYLWKVRGLGFSAILGKTPGKKTPKGHKTFPPLSIGGVSRARGWGKETPGPAAGKRPGKVKADLSRVAGGGNRKEWIPGDPVN